MLNGNMYISQFISACFDNVFTLHFLIYGNAGQDSAWGKSPNTDVYKRQDVMSVKGFLKV